MLCITNNCNRESKFLEIVPERRGLGLANLGYSPVSGAVEREESSGIGVVSSLVDCRVQEDMEGLGETLGRGNSSEHPQHKEA